MGSFTNFWMQLGKNKLSFHHTLREPTMPNLLFDFPHCDCLAKYQYMTDVAVWEMLLGHYDIHITKKEMSQFWIAPIIQNLKWMKGICIRRMFNIISQWRYQRTSYNQIILVYLILLLCYRDNLEKWYSMILERAFILLNNTNTPPQKMKLMYTMISILDWQLINTEKLYFLLQKQTSADVPVRFCICLHSHESTIE